MTQNYDDEMLDEMTDAPKYEYARIRTLLRDAYVRDRHGATPDDGACLVVLSLDTYEEAVCYGWRSALREMREMHARRQDAFLVRESSLRHMRRLLFR